MQKTILFTAVCTLGLGLLAGCGKGQVDPVSTAPGANQDPLYKAHHPVGQAVQVQLPDRDQPSTVILMDGHAYLGDDIIGDVRGKEIIGLSGQAIFKLDGSAVLHAQSSGITDKGLKWPGAVVPFVFDGNTTANLRNQFNQAVQIYNSQTVMRWVPRTNQANYVRVVAGNGCSSYVGMMSTSFKPNGQEVTLGSDGCGVGAALHEMGHASGLMHEQQRQDRDNYITVNYNLIDPNWRSQYDIIRDNATNTAFTPYDVHSIMHYGNSQVNGQWVMTSKTGVAPAEIGQNSGYLTDSDKQAFATIYGSGSGGSVSLPLAYQSLKVTTPGFTNRYARHYNYLGYTEVVDGNSNGTLKADATFRIVRGLADGACYSFEARNFPNNFLRHRDSRVRIDARDGSGLFDQDATWCARKGLSGVGVSLESKNFPGKFLRHYSAELWLASNGGPLASDNAANFNQDASWEVVGAWAP